MTSSRKRTAPSQANREKASRASGTSRASSAKTPRGEETRAKILASALVRFRRRGFDKTTMREIADASGVALGAAYYYFPSKEAIVLAYYGQTQRNSTELATRVFESTSDIRARLRAAMNTRLDVIAADRKLLSALFRSIADPSSPVSVFSSESATVREESVRIFDTAIDTSPEVEALDREARRVLVLALWSLQMGFILYFIHDRSPGQRKTRALVDGVLDLVVGLLPMAPMLAPLLGAQVATILREADLLEG